MRISAILFSKRGKLCVGVVLITLLASAIAVRFPATFLLVDHGLREVDCLVVLGGDNGNRSKRAAEIYAAAPVSFVLVTGHGDDQLIKTALVQQGVPAQRVITEAESTSTYENAAFSAPILRSNKVGRIGIVTSWFHSRRALACFRKAAPELEFFSLPTQSDQPSGWPGREYRGAVCREYVKIFAYPLVHGVWSFWSPMKILLAVGLALLLVGAIAWIVLSGIVKCAEAQDESREDDLPRPDLQ